MRTVRIAPSMMCSSFLNLRDDLDLLVHLGVDMLHLDIMDGHYVENFTLGPDLVHTMHDNCALPLDIHLMIEDVDRYIPRFAVSDRCWLSFHPETSKHPYRTIDLIRSCGARPGIAFDPAVPFETYRALVDEVDLVVVMLVSPGFAGQKLIVAMLEKLKEARRYLDERESAAEIEADGNVSWDNIPSIVEAGATVLVAGTSSLFSKPVDLRKSVPRLKSMLSALGE